VSSALVSSLALDVVLQTAIEKAVAVLGLETGAIYLSDGEMLRLGATTPALPPDLPEHFRIAELADHPHIGECLHRGGPTLLGDLHAVSLTEKEREVSVARGLRSLLYLPLMVEGRALGVAIVGSTQHVHDFSVADTNLCRVLAHQISMAITNAQLFESLQAAYDETLVGWSLALEMRDQETTGHTERVARLAVRLAGHLGIVDEDLVHIRRGALLHDIGKMVVPDAILNKQGSLTEREWMVMRKHPEYAYAFLSRVEHLSPALDIPYCHHERWDGTGYPRGLRGEQIPLSARVFAVLDVYDALTSDRPYRTAWTHADACSYIANHAGTQFDPVVVERFLSELCTDLAAPPALES
jgi:putative nucleotidyltransferase with HDIG domain